MPVFWVPRAFLFSHDTALRYVEAMTVEPDDVVKAAIDRLLVKFDIAGVLGALDLLQIQRVPTSQAALLNVLDPSTFTSTPVNSPAFTANRGYAGLGSGSAYLDTGWTPSTDAVNFAQDDAGFFYYITPSVGTDGQSDTPLMGAATSGSHRVNSSPRGTTDSLRLGINATGASAIAAGSITTNFGLSGGDRASSSTIAGYRNGSNVGTASQTSTGLTDRPVFLLETNSAGSPGGRNSNLQIGLFGIGASIGDAGHAAVDAAWDEYVAAVT